MIFLSSCIVLLWWTVDRMHILGQPSMSGSVFYLICLSSTHGVVPCVFITAHHLRGHDTVGCDHHQPEPKFCTEKASKRSRRRFESLPHTHTRTHTIKCHGVKCRTHSPCNTAWLTLVNVSRKGLQLKILKPLFVPHAKQAVETRQ